MYNSQLHQVFLSLSFHDLREMGKIVQSPYFNQRADVIRLFEYLMGLKKIDRDNWHREKIFTAIYPAEEFEVKKLRHLSSFLLNLIKTYFKLIEHKLHPIAEQMTLCQSLRNRGLLPSYEIQWNKLTKLVKANPHQNMTAHLDQFNYYFQQEDFNNNQRIKRTGYTFLSETSFHLNAFFATGILRQACMQLSTIRQNKLQERNPFLKTIIEEIESGNLNQSISVQIYYHAYIALSKPEDEANFSVLRNQIQEHWKSFPPKEIRDIYLIAINFCIRRLNKGHRNYIKEALDLYKQGLADEVLIEDGKLSGFDYKNTLRLSLALKEFDWAEKFLEIYTQYLPKGERENTHRYNLAFFYFNKPDYEKAMDLLRHVEFNDVFNNLDARRMLLCMYYELKEYDALESLLDSFTVFIHRQKNIGYHRNNYLNLIKFMRRILKGDLLNPTKRKLLADKIFETESVAEKDWLLKQVATS